METKQIKEILSKIGITEDNTVVNAFGETEGAYEIDYYEQLVDRIQQFVEILEIEHHKLVIQYLIEYAKKDVENISKITPYAGSVLEMDLHLAEEYLEYLQTEQKEQMKEELRKLTDNRLD